MSPEVDKDRHLLSLGSTGHREAKPVMGSTPNSGEQETFLVSGFPSLSGANVNYQ